MGFRKTAIVFAFLTICSSLVQTKTAVEDTDLLMTYLIHRHGDRTPLESSLVFAEDPEAVLALIRPYGYAQLTERGMQRGYELGKFIRHRYNDLLSANYNSSEIYIRSTDITRTKMTVLTAMSAVYQPFGPFRWNDFVNWTPVPYTTRPSSEDPMSSYQSCSSYVELIYSTFYSNPPELEPYADLIATVSDLLGYDFTDYPVYTYSIYDYFVSQINLGVPLSSELNSLLPMIKEAAGVAGDIVFANSSSISRGSGVLLQEFYDLSAQIVAGEDVERVRIYSGHDYNIIAMTAITKAVPRQGIPKYGSAYALELRQVRTTGQYVVLPVFLPTPEVEEFYLTIDGCDDVLCDLEQFIELTKENAITESEWKTLCE